MGKNKNEQQKSEQESIDNECETEKVQKVESAEATPADTDEITEAIEIAEEKPDEIEKIIPTKPIDEEKEEQSEQPAINPVPLQSIEAWAAELRISTWQAAALKQSKKYAEGKAVSQADFEAGIKAAINKPQRG